MHRILCLSLLVHVLAGGIPLGRVERFLLGALRPSTVDRYLNAVRAFNSDLRHRNLDWERMTEEEQDMCLSDQLVEWADGEGCYSYGAVLLAAACKMQPQARFFHGLEMS